MGISVTEAPQRSTFVTVLAWIFIVISGYMTLTAVLQNVMLARFLPEMGLGALLAPRSAADVRIPSVIRFFIGHVQVIAGIVLVLAATTLAASIGLLKRENWARRLFIALMVLGIVWNVGALVLQNAFMIGVFAAAHADLGAQFQVIRVMTFAFSLIWAALLSAVFWWIARKLRSAPIVAEFVPVPVGGPLTA